MSTNLTSPGTDTHHRTDCRIDVSKEQLCRLTNSPTCTHPYRKQAENYRASDAEVLESIGNNEIPQKGSVNSCSFETWPRGRVDIGRNDRER
jgi:hypothetical protein